MPKQNTCENAECDDRGSDQQKDDLINALQSFGLLLRGASQWELGPEVRQALRTIDDYSRSLSATFQQINRAVERHAESIASYVGVLEFTFKVGEIRDTIGLLYNYTFPNELLVGNRGVGDSLCDTVLAYYRDSWDAVSSTMQVEINMLRLPTSTKESFREALDAHGRGLYRTVPRTVFPEIESVLIGNGYDFTTRKFTNDLKQLGSDLTLEQFPDAILGMPTWEKFVSHVYSPAETPAQVSNLDGHPVPNRHAAIHGVVDYHTQVQSLNALFLVDFMLRLLPNVNYLNP